MSVTLERSCLNALQRAKDELGHSPSKAEYQELNITPSVSTIARVCGGWNAAKEKAGLEVYNAPKRLPQREPEYTYQDCVEAVQNVDWRHPYQNLTGGIYEEYRVNSQPARATVIKYLGSFKEIREDIL